MDKTSSVTSIEASLQALNSVSLDTIVLLGTLGHYLFSLLLVTNIFLEKIKDNENNFTKDDGIAASQLNDLIRLTINTAQKLSSKTEMIDVIIKREKHQESINNLEQQLQNFINLQHLVSLYSNKIKMNPLMKKYYDESDYKLTLSCMYQVKHYLQKYSNDKFIEFNSSMTGLIEYILHIRSNQLPKSLYWSIDGLQTTSLKEIHLLFPDRVKDSNVSLHNTEKTTSVEEKDIVMNESFHTTSRGIWNGHFLAIQRISSSSSKNIFHHNDIGLRECLNLLGSPIWKDSIYLISLLGFSYDNTDNLYFLYPLHSQRSLHDLLINATDNYKITLSIEQKLSILLDICHGIHFLHSNGIVHGRLKDTNIFLDSNNYRAKISDFGYQSYLSLSTRIKYKGKHGIRWTAPEVIQLEKQFEEKLKKLNQNNTLSNTDYQKLENLLLKYGNCPLSPASDIYSIGILVLVLLTEKIPFFNVVHEEGVKGQLLSHQLPYIPSNFPDADILSPLLDEVYSPCTAPVHQRPTMDQLKAIIESSYCNGIHRVYEKELRGYQEDMNNVKEEINDLIIKIKEHDELVKKGKEIISRKESDKINIMDSKIRREREVEIQKAKMKLVTFQEELEGLKEDKEGAEHDLGELQDLIVEVQKKLSEDKTAVLHQRPDMIPLEEDHVELETYCDDRDIVKIAPLYNPSAGGILTFSSTIAKASPLSSLYTEQFEISPNEAEQVIKDVQKNQFRFKYLADNIEIIFRVPVNFKSLISSSNNAPKKPPSILQYEEPKPSANIVSISSYPTNLPPQRTVNAGYRQEALMSTASDDSSLIGFRAYRNQTQGKDSDDDSDDEDDEDDEVPNETVMQDEEYTDSQWHLSRATTTRVDRYFSTAPVINNTAKELVNDILSGTGWEIPISAPLVPKDVNDNFPSDDIDSLHVQYLAAVRGDWDESIGFRRLNEGIPDDMITAYLENDFTALHLAAFLGNYKILIEFIQQGGLNPSLCDSNGDTPLHCACKRGHYQIVLYLMEECGCSPYSKNQNGIIPIQYALKGGYLNIIEYMMEKATKRVAFNYIDDIFGASLLHWACLSTRVELVDYLIIKQNLKIDLLTNDNMTCLHWACYNSSIEVVKYLIENALADVRKKSNNGWSCLHFATASGSVEKATYLMDTVQLKLTDKDDNFKSPFDVAVGACLLYLQERKAKGFVTGSIAEKNRKEQSNSKEKN